MFMGLTASEFYLKWSIGAIFWWPVFSHCLKTWKIFLLKFSLKWVTGEDQSHRPNFFFKVSNRSRSRSQVKYFCMSGKPLSQGTYMPNMKALPEMVQKLLPMLIFLQVGHRLRLQVKIFSKSMKPLSQGTYMPNRKAVWKQLKSYDQC